MNVFLINSYRIMDILYRSLRNNLVNYLSCPIHYAITIIKFIFANKINKGKI